MISRMMKMKVRVNMRVMRKATKKKKKRLRWLPLKNLQMSTLDQHLASSNKNLLI
jgi:hypothetical protein